MDLATKAKYIPNVALTQTWTDEHTHSSMHGLKKIWILFAEQIPAVILLPGNKVICMGKAWCGQCGKDMTRRIYSHTLEVGSCSSCSKLHGLLLVGNDANFQGTAVIDPVYFHHFKRFSLKQVFATWIFKRPLLLEWCLCSPWLGTYIEIYDYHIYH